MSKAKPLSEFTPKDDLRPISRMLGITGLCVCVPKSWTDEQVEEFANRDAPTGISSKWKIKRQAAYDKDLKNGEIEESAAHERNRCLDRADYVHLILEC